MTVEQLIAGLVALVGAGMAVVNLVWLPFADNAGERLGLVFGGGFCLGASSWFLVRLRRRQRHELTIYSGGTSLADPSGTRTWAWSDVRALAVTTGRISGRLLTIEDDRTAVVERRLPRAHTLYRTLTDLSPAATTIPLRYLDADEAEVVDALRRFSHGRFPDPERRGPRLPSRRPR